MDLLCAQRPSRARHVSSWLERRSNSPGTRTAIRPATRPSARRPGNGSGAPAGGGGGGGGGRPKRAANGSADSSGVVAAGRLAASKAPIVYPLGRGGERGSGGDDGRGHGGRD